MKDRLGSVINILDENEALKTPYSYDAFGQPTATYNSGQIDCAYRFAGREYDTAMGKYSNVILAEAQPRPRARERRLSARDPIFSLQSLYAYCNNSPVNFTDPCGVASQPAGDPGGSRCAWIIIWIIPPCCDPIGWLLGTSAPRRTHTTTHWDPSTGQWYAVDHYSDGTSTERCIYDTGDENAGAYYGVLFVGTWGTAGQGTAMGSFAFGLGTLGGLSGLLDLDQLAFLRGTGLHPDEIQEGLGTPAPFLNQEADLSQLKGAGWSRPTDPTMGDSGFPSSCKKRDDIEPIPREREGPLSCDLRQSLLNVPPMSYSG